MAFLCFMRQRITACITTRHDGVLLGSSNENARIELAHPGIPFLADSTWMVAIQFSGAHPLDAFTPAGFDEAISNLWAQAWRPT